MDSDATPELLTRARAWRDADPDPVTRADLDARIQRVEAGDGAAGDAVAGLRACFEPPLGFGTAGLRGLNGPGPAHMNHRLIQRVTAVLADLLRAEVPDAAERGVVIGYDARHGSAALAETAARTLAGAGFGVHVFDAVASTPLVAFAALELQTAAGLVLTASHNPPEYLGYKVYGARGVQIVPPTDERIAQALAALPAGVEIPQLSADEALASERCPYWRVHGDALRTAHRQATATATAAGAASTSLRVAYSAMHGVAGDAVKAALADQGGIECDEVAEQAAPDGDFPTLRFPNPEEPGALDRLIALAQHVDADIALATDPDGDRLGVALPDDGGQWQVLMGDQTGVLLGDYLMARAIDTAGPSPSGRWFVMNTVVSSRLLERIATARGIDAEQTLTGFKWLWNRALEREAAGDRFLYCYEDSIGFCPTPRVRDKDGIATAVAVTEMAREARAAGATLYARLQGLYRQYGLSVNRQVNLKLEGGDAHTRMAAGLRELRQAPPTDIAGLAVHRVHDYRAAERHAPDGSDPEPIPLPANDLIQFDLAGHCHVSIRPSGTEPKLKIYLEYLGDPGSADLAAERAEAVERLTRIGKALADRLTD
ncbi:hypothetical protein SPICUR_09255 [Spiribacter curvatus]|uniref:Phosphomannomutase n=1 Tax=Spiribacter curvatus TaxID=1335757 RepID=U5T925_9GAMM|nr:phospho-sugar mutase [Spiribacter curvatus]AGY92772.1 hypothetical protein SPICUR_09255 [Spiribacter curvatus]